MADETPPPDRLSNNPRSPHFDMAAQQRGVGIRFKDRERDDVEEYCASEGWIRVAAGMPITVRLNGAVETWWRGEAAPEGAAG